MQPSGLILRRGRDRERGSVRAIALAATLALAVLILWLTLTPVVVPGARLASDKLLHVVAFAALVLPTAVVVPRALVVTAPFALALGGAIEFLQPLVGREREFLDVVANGVGVLAGMACGCLLRRRLERAGKTHSHSGRGRD